MFRRRKEVQGIGKKRKRGQVVVEMLLILPVFLMIVFTIMEMGYLAFWVIVLNHATYECARIGSMIASPPDGGAPGDVTNQLQGFMAQMIVGAQVQSFTEPTLQDTQAGITNNDLVVTGSYRVPLVFPISNLLLADKFGSGHRTITAVVRMPIEQPLPQ